MSAPALVRCRRRFAHAGLLVVFLGLVGLWLGHTLEDIRVAGTAELDNELAEPAYMLPMGVVLALLAAVAGARLWQVWLAMSRRLDRTREHLRALWRNRTVETLPRAGMSGGPSLSGGVASLGVVLTILQLGLYVAQENIEALVEGHAAPGLRVLGGVHAAAPLVHALVAFALAAAATLLARRLAIRREAVRRLDALARTWERRLRRAVEPVRAPLSLSRSPLSVHGAVLWCRPPPVAAR